MTTTATADECAVAEYPHSLRVRKAGFRLDLSEGRWWLLFAVMLVLVGGPVGAQTLRDVQGTERSGVKLEKGYLSINGGYQSSERSLSQRVPIDLYDESGVFDVRHTSSADMALDAAAGVRVWSNLAVGVGVTHFRTRNGVGVSGTLPHPLFYSRPRATEFHVGGFDRTELGIHLHAAWVIPLADRLDVVFSGGPSLFGAEIDGVDSDRDAIGVAETAPYNDVQVDFSAESVQKRLVGANVGVDLTYHLFRSLDPGALFWTAGVGIFVRWTTGTAALPEFGPDETLEVGGLQAGAGLRFRF